jgi:proline dehydrogenase
MDLREKTVSLLPNQAIRLFSGPYVAGDSMAAALEKSRHLMPQKIATTIDVLGEEAASERDVEEYVAIYEQLIDAISTDAEFSSCPEPTRPSISLKPSSFIVAPHDEQGTIREPSGIDWARGAAAIGALAERGAAKEVRVTVDMEDHQWTDFTLELYAELFGRYGRNIGTVIQSRLFRTPDDVERLPDGCRIRLCIGIYDEPASMALRDMRAIKDLMIPLARTMFDKGIFVEFATHDIPLIHRFMKEVIVPGQIGPDRFETQTLLGVPRQRLINRLVTGDYFGRFPGGNGSAAALRQGIVHRLYVPFAQHWDKAIAYCRRRLVHSPNLFWTGFVNAPRVLYHSIFDK